MDPFTEPDPAEGRAFNRLLYRNRRPTLVGHWVSQFFCWWARLGLPPRSWVALAVRDRVSGRMRADAVVIPTVNGRRYVVSMFGTISDWVHNLEAAHGEAVIAHGSAQRALFWSFDWAYNPFYLIYVALFSLSLWTLVIVLTDLDGEQIRVTISPRFPVRTLSTFSFAVGGLLLLKCLAEIVPTIPSNTLPPGATGYYTLGDQGLDLGLLTPFCVTTGILQDATQPVRGNNRSGKRPRGYC